MSITAPRACAWCGEPIPTRARADAIWCSKTCRQTAWRVECRGVARGARLRPIRVAYADPPYPGKARRYYQRSEVDHAQLLARLVREFPDGWALSTSAEALRDVLPLCPPGTHVGPWTKPHMVPAHNLGLSNAWEALLVYGGRQEPPAVIDWLCTHAARGGGSLPGRKPRRFVEWMIACLGLRPGSGDELVDLYPGSGIVGRVWREMSRRTSATASARAPVLEAGPGRSVAPSSSDGSPGATAPVRAAGATA